MNTGSEEVFNEKHMKKGIANKPTTIIAFLGRDLKYIDSTKEEEAS